MRRHALAALTPTLLVALLGCSDDGGTGVGGQGGAGGSTGTAPASWDRDVTPPSDADAEAARLSCAYEAGALPAETQGASRPMGDQIPVDHIVVLMQENRSFDHYFQKLPEYGQPDVEVAPAGYTNPDADGMPVAPYHQTDFCFVDTNHEWNGSHEQYADGLMSGFVLSNDGHGTPPPHPLPDSMSGVRAMGYYDETDIPFYYWLANEFSIADHYFCSVLGPTWPNRDYMYAASSRGVVENLLRSFQDRAGACETDEACGGEAGSCVGGGCKGTCTKDEDCGRDAFVGTCDTSNGVCAPIPRTIFDYMEQRGLDWKVYTDDGAPGWMLTVETFNTYRLDHQRTIDDFYADAAAGTLPQVAFVESRLGFENYQGNDEHPPGTPQLGERFVAEVTDALVKSPNWSSSAMFITYDEHGGLYDHVPPPEACPPGDFPPELGPEHAPGDFDRYGVRVPMILVSPFAKKHHVAHRVYDHTSILRFIQARYVLPAISNRDANAEAPWEMFDFEGAPHAEPPAIDLPTVDPALVASCAAIWER